MSEVPQFPIEEDGIVSGQIRDMTRRHGILKPRFTAENYQELTKAVDQETMFLSGRFESTQSYLDLLMKGPRIVPFLIKDLKKEGDWWRIQMVSFFASEVFRLPIEFPEEIRGRFEPVRAKILEWWEQMGSQHYSSLEPDLIESEIPHFTEANTTQTH